MESRELGSLPEWEHLRSVGARCVIYRRGVRVYYRPAADGSAPDRKATVLHDQSDTSRHRCAFALGNAECDWLAMSVLTWRRIPLAAEVKQAKARLARLWRERWGESVDAWIMEMQARGAPHFHLFHSQESAFGRALQAGTTETFRRRNGKERTVFRGGADHWLVSAWMQCLDDHSPETLAFNRGGIIEPMMSPDAAGRYAAKEAAKREQKILPPHYAEGLGRWWWLAPQWTPRPRFTSDLDLHSWPWETPAAHVWDAAAIAACFTDPRRVPPCADPKQWLILNGYESAPPERDLIPRKPKPKPKAARPNASLPPLFSPELFGV